MGCATLGVAGTGEPGSEGPVADGHEDLGGRPSGGEFEAGPEWAAAGHERRFLYLRRRQNESEPK